MTTLYLAGALFDIAPQHHNFLLEAALQSRGYNTILPQREALRFFDGTRFNLEAVRNDCRLKTASSDAVVATIDGADTDAGTAIEIGIAVASKAQGSGKPFVICVRTDFRTDMEREIGVNGMLLLADKVLYRPAFITAPTQVDQFYNELAADIDTAIQQLQSQHS